VLLSSAFLRATITHSQCYQWKSTMRTPWYSTVQSAQWICSLIFHISLWNFFQLTWSVNIIIKDLPGSNKLCRRPPQYAAAPVTLTFDLDSGVQVTCDMAYLCANFSLPRPLCSRLRPDVTNWQTSDAHHRLMSPTLGWVITIRESLTSDDNDNV